MITPVVLIVGLVVQTATGCDAPPHVCDPATRLRGVTPTITLAEGGRAMIGLSPARDRIDVDVRGLAAGFSWTIKNDLLFVSAPYGINGRVPAELVATCAAPVDGAVNEPPVALPLTLEVQPLRAVQLVVDGDRAAPAPRDNAALVVVAGAPVVVAGTGATAALDDAWRLDGEVWRRLALDGETPRGAARGTSLGARRALVQVAGGGVYELAVADGLADAPSITAWTRGGAVPSSSWGGGLVHHGASGLVLSVCGGEVGGAGAHCRVSALPLGLEASWSTLEPTGFAPQGRVGAVVVVDAESNRLIVSGGARADGPGKDTWSLVLDTLPAGPVTWEKVAEESTQNAPRAWACGAVDPIGHRLFVVGGNDGTGARATVRALNLDDEEPRWRDARVTPSLPARTGCSAAWDDEHARILVGFGADEDGRLHNDLWSLEL
jgi:hypothetical protein